MRNKQITFVTDAAGNVLYVDQKLCEILGLKLQDTLLRNMNILFDNLPKYKIDDVLNDDNDQQRTHRLSNCKLSNGIETDLVVKKWKKTLLHYELDSLAM